MKQRVIFLHYLEHRYIDPNSNDSDSFKTTGSITRLGLYAVASTIKLEYSFDET